ncbi:phospholipase B1, membrane-associated-like isoform X2 [Oscarella lobularis]|uniref:phospholipase B1, membrane-associated-like isoform X2 n=1 Tax=Oscarella lobularis TaxID=121494 RepID=UPI0033132E47
MSSCFGALCFLFLAFLAGADGLYLKPKVLQALAESYSESKMHRRVNEGSDPEMEVVRLAAMLRDVANIENFTATQLSPVGAEFSCPRLEPSPEVPQSVHQLRPSDIKVIGALGDSISAAFLSMAETVLDVILVREYVGNSWSIGSDYGDPTEAATLANFLGYYNENLRGSSTGTCRVLQSGTDNCRNGNFNTAKSAAKARAMLGQAERLVALMQADPDVNIEEDWKVVTLWIGGNDLCQFCNNNNRGATPEEYEEYLTQALDYLHENLPRTFVNLVSIIDVAMLQEVSSDIRCTLFHLFECSCLDRQEQLTEYALEYRSRMHEVIDSGRYDTKDDFTVVIQPFYEEAFLPENPIDYFAADCFHFNSKGQAVAAVSLWNNMVEPVGSKSTQLAIDLEAKCPQEPYYLFTKKNSV